MTLATSNLRKPIAYEWSSLPVELRLQIFGYVVEKQKYRASHLSRFACVSFEWQEYFEQLAFRRLLIDNSQLARFSKVTKDEKAVRLSYIRYLCLRIKLRDYDYPECNRPEPHATINSNNQRFTHSLNELFLVLRRWNPTGNRDTGLILEITAYSPGDNMFSRDVSTEYELHENFQLEEDLESSSSVPEFIGAKKARDLLAHGKNWDRVKTIRGIERLHGTPFELSTRRDFQPVPVIHTLWLRHQFHRGIADSSLARILRKTLTSVTSFRLEIVADTYALMFMNSGRQVDYNNLILQLPNHIRRFSFNLLPRSPPGWEISFIGAMTELPESLAMKAHRLVSLCPPAGMNPLEFILHLRKPQLSQELERGSRLAQLCLEVPNDVYGEVSLLQDRIDRLLTESAITAQHLPKLEILEIWWYDGLNACLFRYEREKDQVAITWRVTEDWVTLAGESIQQWAGLAQKYNMGFSVKEKPFLRVTRRSIHIDGKSIYQHLKLCDLAIDPVTLAYVEAKRPW